MRKPVFSMRKTFGETMTFAAMRAAFPPWVLVAGTRVFDYILINFALVMMAGEGSNVLIENGKYLLFAKGEPSREISLARYRAFRANDMRGFSGYGLIFYFVPFAYFVFRKPITSARGSEGSKGGA